MCNIIYIMYRKIYLCLKEKKTQLNKTSKLNYVTIVLSSQTCFILIC